MSEVGQGPQNPTRLTYLAKDFSPWTPDIDARKTEKPGIMSGSNFRDGLDGPISAFGSQFANWNLFDTASRVQVNALPIDNDMLYGTPTGVYRIDSASQAAINILPITITKAFWPWTIAKVGGVYYLAQYDIGLWQYDPVNQTMKQITTPSGNQIRYVAESYGRLIYFDATVVAISALDDGTNFTPSLSTAAGAQSLSMIGGTPYAIVSIPDGFVVYTSNGTLKATYTTQAYVFAYTKLSQSIRLFSPNAAVYCPLLGAITVDGSGLFLTREYNYTTYGYPQPWEEEKSDYIKKNIIAGMNQQLPGCIGTYYSKSMQIIFFYFAGNASQGLFTTTLCYDAMSKKWGSFNQPHYGIFEVLDPTTNSLTCAYMDTSGYMQEFNSSDYCETYSEDNTSIAEYVYRPGLVDRTAVLRVQSNPATNGGNPFYEGYSGIKFSDNAPLAYAQFTAPGLYTMNNLPYSDTSFGLGDVAINTSVSPYVGGSNINDDGSGGLLLYAVPYNTNESGLNSSVTIGPFRLNDQTGFGEETSCIESIILGMQSNNSFVIYLDWNTMAGSLDYNNLTGNQDWGSGAQTPLNYEVTLLDCDDAFSQPFWGDETLTPFLDNGASRLYKPSGISSIYHTVTISAMNSGELFALKIIDITAQATGVELGI